jgi:hypothetical protein
MLIAATAGLAAVAAVALFVWRLSSGPKEDGPLRLLPPLNGRRG